MSDQENLNLMCPIHKRKVLYLVLDGKSDPFVLKCDICQVQKNFQNPILIEDLLQSDDSTIFRNWPIQKNLYTYKKLEQLDEISKWFDDKKENIIDDLFTDFKNTVIQKIDTIKKDTLKRLQSINEIKQKTIDLYNELSFKEELKQTLKIKATGECQEKEINEKILNIINKNEQNFEQNYQKISTLIEEAAYQYFNQAFCQSKMKDIYTLIDQIDFFQGSLDKEIHIKNLEELQLCLNYQNINIDLKKKNLNESDIKNICETLKDCKEITDLQLDLSDNYVGVEGAICIATAISKYKNIMKLHFNLESNQFGDEGVSKISSAISQYQNITELGLFFMGNQISQSGAKYVAEALYNLQNLTELILCLEQKQLIMDIINIEMSDKEILNQICPVHKRTVISLGLDDKNDPQVMKCIQCQEYKTPQSSIYIEDLLQSDNTTIFRNWPIQEDHNCYRQLKQLDDISKWFSDSKEKQIDDFFTEFKSRIIQKIDNIKKDNLKKLERINEINNNNIGVEGAISIAAAISQYKDIYLLVLNLRKCQINSYGVKVILNSIQNYEKITSLTLDFRSNTFGDEGVSKIINAIKNWDQGVVYLSKAIQNCQNISTLVLVLGKNKIDQSGAQSIADSLQKVQKLSKLTLDFKLNNLTAVDQDTLKYSFEMLKAKIPELCQLDI
ncbi:hypothetical protein ABPG74_013074 [Tetrahymena malaccensis]